MSDAELYRMIGRNIKFYRKKHGITQKEFCESTGISLSYLTKLEAENCMQSISLSFLNKIANSLDVNISKFFEEDV